MATKKQSKSKHEPNGEDAEVDPSLENEEDVELTEQLQREEEERVTRQTKSDPSKRRTRKPSDPSDLRNRPSIKAYIKIRGELFPFTTPKGALKTVNRSSADCIAVLEAMIKKDNKKARTIIDMAIVVAGASNHKTLDRSHVMYAQQLLEMATKAVLTVVVS
jgi:hypothetical protein